MTIRDFTDLDAWQKGREVALVTYRITGTFPDAERFGLVSQLRRAATSITANIAEGFERHFYRDKLRFYFQARGSLAEVRSFLILAEDLGFLSSGDRAAAEKVAQDTHRLLNGLITSTRARVEGEASSPSNP